MIPENFSYLSLPKTWIPARMCEVSERSIRRDCLGDVIVLDERHLRRVLGSYLDYYHRSRTHLSLGKDAPDGRPIQPVGGGKIVAFPQVGGLHRRYERLAA